MSLLARARFSVIKSLIFIYPGTLVREGGDNPSVVPL